LSKLNLQMTYPSIRKAVFPVAGLGTRFLPATKASPKEMLCVVDKPLIQYAVEEAVEAGITDMIFVTCRHKRVIEDHFDAAPELEAELLAKGKHELLHMVQNILPKHINCIFVRQNIALGLGHAVLCASPVVGNEPFAVILADDLMVANEGQPNVTAQLVEAYQRTGGSILAVQHVPREQTGSYGIVCTESRTDSLSRITAIVEKPVPSVAPSTLAVAGRYVLTPGIFEYLQTTHKGAGGEIQLTDAIAMQIKKESTFAQKYENSIRYDCGSKLGLLQANVAIALKHKDIGRQLKSWLALR
jgi:UTP--glucose-1-phosphate uridylyltransferase